MANPQHLFSDLRPHPQHAHPSNLALSLHTQEFRNLKKKIKFFKTFKDSHL